MIFKIYRTSDYYYPTENKPSQKRSEKLSKKLDIVILELNIRKGEKLKWKKNILS